MLVKYTESFLHNKGLIPREKTLPDPCPKAWEKGIPLTPAPSHLRVLPQRDERSIQEETRGTSLAAQWLRIRLPKQGTQVRALVWEDPTCRGATKPVRLNYLACALEPTSHNY